MICLFNVVSLYLHGDRLIVSYSLKPAKTMNNQQQRDEIEEFCQDFLMGNNKHLHNVIDNYRHLLAQIDLKQLQLTEDTLDRSFQTICREVFTHRVGSGNIIAILGFSKEIHNYHYASSWYNINTLTNSLVNVLSEFDFHPNQLIPSSNCIIL